MLKTVQLINTSAFGNGTVTQVQGNGTVNGITLTGNVTSSGNITLGGTLGSIANSQLSNSSVTIGNTTISLGGTATSLGNIALANVSTTGLTGYLYGNDGTGNVTASTTIPNTGLANSTITLGNATLTLGSTTTAVGNLTLNNVTITSGTENNVTYTNATISSVKTTFPNTFLTNNSVTIGNTSVSLGSTVTSFGNVTLTNATISSLSTPITTTEGGTGLTSFTGNGVVYASNSSTLATSSAFTFNGTDVGFTGNLVPGTAAKGINFTANTPAAGKTSQLLNWYEEGTWTPIDSSGASLSFTIYGATYTRIGRLVTCNLAFKYPVTASVLTATIGGLPFTSGSYGNGTIQGYIVATTAVIVMRGVYNGPGVTTFVFDKNNATATATNADLSNAVIYLTIIYQV